MANIPAPARDNGCKHTGTFQKRKIRDALSHRNPLTPPCVLCTILYPFWKNYADTYLVSSSWRSGSGDHYVSDAEFLSLEPGEFPFTFQRNRLEFSKRGEQAYSTFTIKLKGRQFGEAYHALICALILRESPKYRILIVFDKTKAITDIRNLFDWHRIDAKPGKIEGTSSKKMATEIIAALFRGTRPGPFPQPSIFKCIRKFLLSTGADVRHCNQLHRKYFEPTYAAKYWLNRYLSLTKQGKLPKKDDIGRLAVIHIRRRAATLVKRVMDDQNLEDVATSIAHANILARKANESEFTHIVLFGDFDYSEADVLKSKVEKAIQKAYKETSGMKRTAAQSPDEKLASDQVTVLFVSNPWKRASNDLPGMNREVSDFWKKFRDPSFDHLPTQVKTLAIWTTLCERYHPNMCVIGHRSGFVEGAGFIGIPIFYLNNERKKIYLAADDGDDEKALSGQTKFKVTPGPGDLLWRAAKNPDGDRLREISNVMDTFIPIEALERGNDSESESESDVDSNSERNSESESDGESDGESDNEGEDESEGKQDGKRKGKREAKRGGNSKRQSKGKSEGKGKGKSEEKGKGKSKKPPKVIHMEKEYKGELTAALFMFMCCDFVRGLSLGGLEALELKPGENPGWIARVDMMRHKCEGHEPGPKGCRDADFLKTEEGDVPQTGQEWLRRRWLFATSDTKVPLLPWTGVMTGDWWSEDIPVGSVRTDARGAFDDPPEPVSPVSSRLPLDWDAIGRQLVALNLQDDVVDAEQRDIQGLALSENSLFDFA